MQTFKVRLQVIKVWDIDVEAKDEVAAVAKAEAMQSTDIEANGVFKDVTVDFAEVVES